jgi:hypothetical protein
LKGKEQRKYRNKDSKRFNSKEKSNKEKNKNKN